MIIAKPHIHQIYRTGTILENRRKCLRLDMNEHADGLPDEFVAEVFSMLDANHLSAYPEYASLIRKIADHNGINRENICLSNGSDAAIKYIFEAYVSAGDKVLLTDPTFAMYPIYGEMFAAKVVKIPYGQDLELDTEAFLSEIDGTVRLAVLVNPNNPTGSVLSVSEIDRIIDKCKHYGTLLVIDEAYYYYCPTSCIRQIDHHDNVIVLRTFSKLCALAALRIGYAAAAPDIIANLNRVRPTFDVNAVAVHFAECLLDADGLIEDQIRLMKEGKRFLVSRLRENHMAFQDGHANFVLIKCPGFVAEITGRLKDRHILVSGGFRQECLKDFIRVTVGSIEKMEQFWRVFFDIWQRMAADR